MLTAPLVVLRRILHAVGRTSRIAAVALTIALFVTSLAAIARTREFYRNGLSDSRTMAPETANPNQLFFGDFWAVLHLTLSHAIRPEPAHSRCSHDAERHQGACVMLGEAAASN